MWDEQREKFRYKFENFMARGGISIFISLFVLFILCFLVALLVRGILLMIFPENDLIGNTFEHMWAIFLMMTDPGNMGIDMESSGYIRISTIIAGMLGVIIFSMLIAFITTTVDTMLDDLKKGYSKVIEKGQTLILGWNDRILDILKELIIANESEEDASIVILADKEKEDMDVEISTFLPDTKTTRIITRSGNTSSLTKLQRISADKAKSAIILGTATEGDTTDEKMNSDAKVIKTILALIGSQGGENKINIVAELFQDENRELLGTFESDRIVSVKSWTILAKILVQTSRTSGLAVVYNEILSFDGCELYFYKGDWKEKRFYDLLFHFRDGVPLGIRREDGTLLVRPERDTMIGSQDEVLILAEDDSTIQYSQEPIFRAEDHPYTYQRLETSTERELILGWHCITPIIIGEYSQYIPEGSSIDIMVSDPGKEILQQIRDIKKEYKKLKINVIKKNPMNLEDLASADPYSYDNILILSHCEGGLSPERVDSETLFILLLLRKILRDQDIQERKTKLITQVLNSENQELITQTNVDDFLISNKMISMMFAQLSEELAMKNVYDDLFQESGSEIYLKPASLYFESLPIDVSFVDIVNASLKRDEICIGVRMDEHVSEPGRNFGISLNPKKDTRFKLRAGDSLVVLSEDEY